MSLEIYPSAEEAGCRLADQIEAALRTKPSLVMGLATGRTSTRAYEELVRRHHLDATLTFRHATAFNTDEYLSLSPHDPRSNRYFMNYHLYRQVDICRENTHIPRGDAPDLVAECKAFDLLIQARGGLDLVVLGLGHNGHVGFNEPGSSPKSRTRIVEFTDSTRAALSTTGRFARLEETPNQAITVGLATILEAKRIYLIATGIGKAEAVARVVEGKAGPSVPASQLLQHPNLTVIVDKDAASQLSG